MGCVYLYVIIMTFLGPEYLGRSLHPTADRDFEDATGREVTEKELLGHQNGHQNGHHNGVGHEAVQKKDVDEIDGQTTPTGVEKI